MPYEQIIKDTAAATAVAFLKNDIVGVETNPEWGTDVQAYIFTVESEFDTAINILETDTGRTDFIGQNPPPR